MWAGSAGGHACPDDPNRGNIYIESNASTFIKAGKYLIGSSFNKLTLKSTNYVAIDGADIFLNSEMSVEAEKTAPDPEH